MQISHDANFPQNLQTLILNLTLYVPCIVLQCVDKQRDAQILVNSLYFFVKWVYGFQTIISPSPGATFNKLYSSIGNCAVQLIKCCSWWWTNDSPKHLVPFNEKIKTIHKNLCVFLVLIFCLEARQNFPSPLNETFPSDMQITKYLKEFINVLARVLCSTIWHISSYTFQLVTPLWD